MNTIIISTINEEAAPNYVVSKAFRKQFYVLAEFEWYEKLKANVPMSDVWLELEKLVCEKKPNFLFLQIQNINAVNLANAEIAQIFLRISKITKIINWTGDVRDDADWLNWFFNFGQLIYLTLFSNEFQVNVLKAMGLKNVSYLQIGYDNINYTRQPKLDSHDYGDIVFCANNYSGLKDFPLSEYRKEVALQLKNKYGERFRVFGFNWQHYGINTRILRNYEEAQAYNNAKIAISISHYDYDRYFSDRLLRILGSGGAIALSHNYNGIHKDWVIGKHLDAFDTIPELMDKIDFYLTPSNEDCRQSVVNLAYSTAHTLHTWEARCMELKKLLDACISNNNT